MKNPTFRLKLIKTTKNFLRYAPVDENGNVQTMSYGGGAKVNEIYLAKECIDGAPDFVNATFSACEE